MAVRIRLSRFGRLHRPYFRIVACDKRVHREGVANEILGVYDPLLPKQNLQIDVEALKAWIAKGALISTEARWLRGSCPGHRRAQSCRQGRCRKA